MKKILLFILFTAQLCTAQENGTPQLYSQLKVEIKDVVEQKQLVDLELLICSEHDTVAYQITAESNLIFELKYPGRWSSLVVKQGYDTLLVEWYNPVIPTELVLECYLPKTKLSFFEKRRAHANSRNLPEAPCTNCGGFQRISVGYNEMCVMRMYEYQQDETYNRSYEFRKLRYY